MAKTCPPIPKKVSQAAEDLATGNKKKRKKASDVMNHHKRDFHS